jgi:AraC family transcriptional regulator
MQPAIIDVAEKNVVGIGAPFISILSPDRNNMIVIPKLWESFVGRQNEVATSMPGLSLGVCSDMPADAVRTHDDEFFYIAGVEVASLATIPEGMTGMTIPAGRYAQFTHRGRIDSLGVTIDHIYSGWLPGSGYRRRDGAPEIEVYDHRFDPASDTFEMQILVPVE